MNRHLPLLVGGAICAALLELGCASTSPTVPSVEVLLVVNSTEASLSIVPLSGGQAVKVPLGGTSPTPVGVSARNEIAIVPMGLDNTVVVVDLRQQTVLRAIPLPANSGATGSAIVDDSIAYVADPNIDSVTRVNYLTGATSSLAVGVYPQGVVYTRGKIFVINGNLVNFSPGGPSWITVIDPVTNARATGIDSIPLQLPGNAGFAAVGGDGQLYVMNTGDFVGDGRLSRVDPVDREETATFGGFGVGPQAVAADGGEHIFVSSYSEGLMEFDTQTATVVRGAGNGVPIPSNATVVVDAEGRIYAAETGPCAGGVGGTIHVLRTDLSESGTFTVGECPVGLAVSNIPPP